MKSHHFKNELQPIAFDKCYSKDESKRIIEGFLAPTMDDRWDLIYKNEELGIYRSWTGRGFFQLKFEIHDQCLHVINTYVDEQFLHEYSPDYCSAFVNWIIEFILFKRNIDLPKWNYE